MLAKLRRPKMACSPSYADYRPKTNTEMLLHMGHTLKEIAHGKSRETEGNIKLECG
jgi:hypothetical protein